jgi:DNA-binding transcriptional LysR family regulator
LAEGSDLKRALSGTLSVGYYAPGAPAFLPEILASFLPSDTRVTLDLHEFDNDQEQDGFLNGTCDVIFLSPKICAPL